MSINTARTASRTSPRALALLRERRGRPPRPAPRNAGDIVLKALSGPIAKAGPSSTRLEARWASIVGDKLARVTAPGKVVKGPRGRELTVHVLPAAAVIVEHQSELIRQRVSIAAGGDIVGIRLKQGALTPTATPVAKPVPQPKAPLSPEARAAIEEAARGIQNSRLRAAIVALGEAMLTDKT